MAATTSGQQDGHHEDFRVLIMGAGVCGLAIAHGLKNAGIAYTVYERDTEDVFANKSRDWGMIFHWGAEYLMKMLPQHLQERIHEPRVDPHYKEDKQHPYQNGKTGEVIQYIGLPGSVRVSRKKLRKFLTEGENLNIEFERKLETVRIEGESVIARFEDGTEAKGNVIIGAEGSRSRVRQFLVGEEAAKPVETGITMINYFAGGFTAEEAHRLREPDPITQLCVHPDLPGAALVATLDAADKEHPETWQFQMSTSWHGAPTVEDLQDMDVRRTFLKYRLSQFCDPYRTMGTAVDRLEKIPLDRGQQWVPSAWDNRNGLVTLAGDAAHSMLPHRGQGLNNAMQDAAEVVKAITSAVSGSSTLRDAISAYEDEMIPRGAKECALTLEIANKTKSMDLAKENPIFKVGLSKQEPTQNSATIQPPIIKA